MDMFGASDVSRRLALIVGGLMLALVGLRGAVPMPADMGSKLLLGPAAFFEEVLFRGAPLLLLMRGGLSKAAKIGGVVVASIAFTVLHPVQHLVMYIDTFVFSLLAFAMSLVIGSVWPAVAFHVVANLTATSVASPLYDS